MRGYIEFLLQNHKPKISTESSLLKLLEIQRAGFFTQLGFIENFLINFEIKVNPGTSSISSKLSNSKKKPWKDLSVVVAEWQITDPDFFDKSSQEVPLRLQREMEERSCSLGGLRNTRAWAPFIPAPPLHYPNNQQLQDEDLDLIQKIRSSYQILEKKKNVIQVLTSFPLDSHNFQMLDTLVLPYTKVMRDLPGGTHNCCSSTVLAMSKALDMCPTSTIWADFGSGAPIIAIQGNVFAKQTLCLDLPSVMKMVRMILSYMNSESKGLINQIYLESGLCTVYIIQTDSSLQVISIRFRS